MEPLRVNATIEFNRIGSGPDDKGVLHPRIAELRKGRVLTGANGTLEISDDGILWEPGWLGRMRKTPSFSLSWSEIRTADIVDIFARGLFILDFFTRRGATGAVIGVEAGLAGVDFIVPTTNKSEVIERLGAVFGRD